MDPVVGLVVRGALAVLFAAAAVHKLRDRRHFDGVVLDYRLLPPQLALRVARLLPALELALAFGLVWGFSLAAPAAAALLLGYGAAMAVNLARGHRTIDCGCGGPPQRLSGWLVARNAVLAGAALVTVLPAGLRPQGALDGLTVLGAVAAIGLLYVACGQLLANAPGLRALVSRHD